eukprot:2369788-Alexandrium_andersonii.AAC.1
MVYGPTYNITWSGTLERRPRLQTCGAASCIGPRVRKERRGRLGDFGEGCGERGDNRACRRGDQTESTHWGVLASQAAAAALGC